MKRLVSPALFMLLFIGASSVPYLVLASRVSSGLAVAHGRWLDSVFPVPAGLYRFLTGPGWSGLYELPHLVLLVAFAPAMLVFAPRRRAWCCCLEIAALFVVADVIFLLFPAAPPWIVLRGGAMPISGGIAMYSAFPSYHVALGCVVARYGGEWGRWYAVVIGVLVVLTGNHWIADVVAGWLLDVVVVCVGRHVHRRSARARRWMAALVSL